MELQNAVALITGTNRGIGRAFVDGLAARGVARVYAATRRPEAALPRDGRVEPLILDITDRAQVRAAAARASDVTLLINNAGVADFGSVLDLPDEALRRNLETNYFGTLDLIRAFAPVIERNGGGGVVNVITIVALASMPGLGAYNASKAAAWSMTQSVRAELGPRGIQVHGVFPGAVDTDMIRAMEMPKTSPADVVREVLDGIEAGTDDIFPDPMSRQIYGAWKLDHKAVERQFGAM